MTDGLADGATGGATDGVGHLFALDGPTLVPTDLVRGPWRHDMQHGGAVSGALGFAVTEECRRQAPDNRFALTRLTTEILRPVPVAPLRYGAETVRRGRRSRVVAAELHHNDVLVARASSQWATTVDSDGGADNPGDRVNDSAPDAAVPLRPLTVADPGAANVDYPRPGFNCDVFEMRCLDGSTEQPGPGVIWVRMVADLIYRRPNQPVHVLATLADLGNAVGWDLSPAGNPMINPDLTLQIFRYPVGEWVCLQSAARATGAGIGIVETRLWDGDGQFGLTLSTSMESPIPLSLDPSGGAEPPTE